MAEKRVVEKKPELSVADQIKALMASLPETERAILVSQEVKSLPSTVKADIAKAEASAKDKAAATFNALCKEYGSKALSVVSPKIGEMIDSLSVIGIEKDKKAKMLGDKVLEHKGRTVRVSLAVSFDFDPPKRAVKALGGDAMFRKTQADMMRRNQEAIDKAMAEIME